MDNELFDDRIHLSVNPLILFGILSPQLNTLCKYHGCGSFILLLYTKEGDSLAKKKKENSMIMEFC
jgi:hypothetical protein